MRLIELLDVRLRKFIMDLTRLLPESWRLIKLHDDRYEATAPDGKIRLSVKPFGQSIDVSLTLSDAPEDLKKELREIDEKLKALVMKYHGSSYMITASKLSWNVPNLRESAEPHTKMSKAAKDKLRRLLLDLSRIYPHAKWTQEPMPNWYPRYWLKGKDIDGFIQVEYQEIGDPSVKKKGHIRNWFASFQFDLQDEGVMARALNSWGSKIHSHSMISSPSDWWRVNADVLLDEEPI